MNSLIPTAVVYENSSIVLLARVARVGAAAYLTPATTTSITVETYDVSDPYPAVATMTPAVASVVYDTLQTDSRWRADDIGYNVAIPIPSEHLPTGGTDYQIEVTIEPSDGYTLRFAFAVHTVELYGV